MRGYLDEIGSMDGQGWLYGRATSKEELIKLLPQIALAAGGYDINDLKVVGEPDSSAVVQKSDDSIARSASA